MVQAYAEVLERDENTNSGLVLPFAHDFNWEKNLNYILIMRLNNIFSKYGSKSELRTEGY